MISHSEQFTLRTSLSSPYGRKLRIAAEVLGLSERVAIAPADTADENDTIRRQNPLGKMPCLVRADGTSLFDSSVILEFLQYAAGTNRLLPVHGPERFPMLTQTRLADGIIDAGALVLYEHRYHEPDQVSERWLGHQRGKMQRALAAFETAPPDARTTNAVTIGLACALGFLDKRKPVEWRANCPALADWFEAFAANEPAFELTRPPTS